jgi:hypothetical protein
MQRLANYPRGIVGGSGRRVVTAVSMIGETVLMGVGHALKTGSADGGTPAVVFVVGGHVTDAGMSHAVVEHTSGFEFVPEHGRVIDPSDGGGFGLDVPEQPLDEALAWFSGWGGRGRTLIAGIGVAGR